MSLAHEQLARAFSILGHRERVRLLKFILDNTRAETDEPMVPTYIARCLDRPESNVAHSLRRMSEAGVLDRRESGRFVFYTVNETFLTNIRELIQ